MGSWLQLLLCLSKKKKKKRGEISRNFFLEKIEMRRVSTSLFRIVSNGSRSTRVLQCSCVFSGSGVVRSYFSGTQAWVDPKAQPDEDVLGKVPIRLNIFVFAFLKFLTFLKTTKFCRDLTLLAKNGKLDPVIGRDEDIRRTLTILARRSKNNAMV